MGNINDVIKCMYKGELFSFLPKWAIEDEYDLPDDKLSEVMSSNKGDVVSVLDDAFENIGGIYDLLNENVNLRKSKISIWRKLTKRNCENGKLSQINSELSKQNAELLLEREALKADVERLKHNLSVLSSALSGVLLFTDGLDVDDDGIITSSGTGEILSE